MCSKGMCCSCIPVRNGCQGVAIYMLIDHIYSIYTGFKELASNNEELASIEGVNPDFLKYSNAVSILLDILSIGFIIYLFNGIRAAKPGPVKTFLIFGLIALLLKMIYTILFYVFVHEKTLATVGISILVIDAILYALFLLLVYHTLKDIQGNNNQEQNSTGGRARATELAKV